MRVLSKGASLPFVHQSVDWDESINFKDYDVVFVNLKSLEEISQELDHPYNKSESSPEIFKKNDVREFLNTTGHLVICLPENPILEMGEETTLASTRQIGSGSPDKTIEYNALRWLPFDVTINTNETGSSVNVLIEDWKWYFEDSFHWKHTINIKSRSSLGIVPIAMNSYERSLATQVAYNNGTVSIIPPRENYSYSEFVKRTLSEVFDLAVGVEGRAPPEWIGNYNLPKEFHIEDQIETKQKEITQLQNELDELVKYKRLLYETDDLLEEIVRHSLRELGYTVDGEIPGGRDGVLHTDDTQYALEITGTTGGIKKGKLRQLDDYVEKLVAKSPEKKVSGLLIVNPFMDQEPETREIRLEPNVRDYIDQRGDYKILLTTDLYRIMKVELSKGDAEDKFTLPLEQDNTILQIKID